MRPRAEVEAEAIAMKKVVLFGSLTDMCLERHGELPPEQRSYQGRVVFRGDNVKDEEGYFAAFSEQGTSASHLAATKFSHAIARLPGNHGEESDTVGVYNQVSLDETGDKRETWIDLPKLNTQVV